jgi:hypothetical protein
LKRLWRPMKSANPKKLCAIGAQNHNCSRKRTDDLGCRAKGVRQKNAFAAARPFGTAVIQSSI